MLDAVCFFGFGKNHTHYEGAEGRTETCFLCGQNHAEAETKRQDDKYLVIEIRTYPAKESRDNKNTHYKPNGKGNNKDAHLLEQFCAFETILDCYRREQHQEHDGDDVLEDKNGRSTLDEPRFAQSGFESRGVSANYTSEAATLFSAGAASRIVSQSVTVEKTPEQKAREAADMVFLLRRNRIQIITGDTDATYSGEAMKAAIDELSALEQEYLSLFLGYTITQEQKVTFELSPSSDAKDQIYVIFRLSDQEGLLPAEEIGGKPYYLDIAPQEMASAPAADPRAASRAKAVQTVRIPAICDLKVSDGVKTFLQSRIPVYQLGEDRVYPVQ